MLVWAPQVGTYMCSIYRLTRLTLVNNGRKVWTISVWMVQQVHSTERTWQRHLTTPKTTGNIPKHVGNYSCYVGKTEEFVSMCMSSNEPSLSDTALARQFCGKDMDKILGSMIYLH